MGLTVCPPILFKRLKHILCYPLALFHNQLVSVGHVPREWLAAHIVPVHKKRITSDVYNYRPISLTCVLSKILERIIVGRLFYTIFIVIIFCILLNMVSLNIAPLVPIYLRATMIGTSLYNTENRTQLFISISLNPSIWFRNRNCS